MSAFRYYLLLLTLLPSILAAQAYYAMTEPAVKAYEQLLNLEMEAAAATLQAIKIDDPDNLVVHHLENYRDFFQLYLSEDAKLLERRLPLREERLEALEKLPTNSPWRNYALAEIRLHWALIRIRFESYYPAFRDVNKAHKLLRENAEKFPEFLPTYKDLGLLHAAVGTIPPQFKWGVELFSSLNGSIAEGSAEMELAMTDTSSPFYRETAVLYALLQLHLNNRPDKAWALVNQLQLQPEKNKLHCFVLANVAMRSGRNDRAVRLLEHQPRGGSADDFPYLDFMLGLARIRKLDYGGRVNFQSFLLRFHGQHFVKEATQKIAWCELLLGRDEAYRATLSSLGLRGNATSGGDRNADNEALGGRTPHTGLLRARLLFDGAYYQRARAEIDAIAPASLQTATEQLELIYRTGRILDGLKDTEGALSFYERTIVQGRDADSFFACNAALRAGLLEAGRGNKTRARHYFETCLEMSPSEYKTGLHIQAKAGLNRL